jgi:hypothetical protein
MVQTALGLLLVIAILAASAYITQFFATHMYHRCTHCLTLNARRRDQCRQCGQPLEP